ncbi:MAG TPA: histidine phosphatase family protein, partial [Pseudoxanthomonas sp.]|nr:histidine phosphatase family protein [Pseudoxanthomonas sp.]
QSQWNLENRFTGWVDVDLTAEGEAQARRGGELALPDGVLASRRHLEALLESGQWPPALQGWRRAELEPALSPLLAPAPAAG